MRGEREQVGPVSGRSAGEVADGGAGIGVKRNAPAAAEVGDFGERGERADFVAGSEQRDEAGVAGCGTGQDIGQGAVEFRERDAAERVDREKGDGDAATGEGAGGVEGGAMLGGGGDEAACRFAATGEERAFDREVIGLGRATGEDDVVWGDIE